MLLRQVCAVAFAVTVSVHSQVQSRPPSWGLDRIDQRSPAPDGAYHYAYTGAGVTIYVIDTGVLETHDDFVGRIQTKGDFCRVDANGSPTSMETHDLDVGPGSFLGHGTHNASLAAGTTYGVAKGASIVALRAQCLVDGKDNVMDDEIAATNAVKWIRAHGSRPAVINLSFAWTDSSTSRTVNGNLQNELVGAIDDRFVVTLSAGCASGGRASVNDHWGPTLSSRALVVAGTDSSDRASSIAYGSGLALFAPAVGIKAAGILTHDNEYTAPNQCVDSYAAPHVAGIAALFLQMHPDWAPSDVRRAIVGSATAGVLSNVTGGGTPNLLAYAPALLHAK